MRYAVRVVLLLAVAAAGVVLPGTAAQACSCVMAGAAQQLEWADAVFTGEIVDKGAIGSEPVDDLVGSSRTFTFNVDQVFKGKVDGTATVRTASNSAACGIDLPSSGDALVFASKSQGDDETLTTGLCSGTRTIKSGEAIPAALGAGESPSEQTQTSTTPITSAVGHTPMPTFWERNSAAIVLLGLVIVIAGVSVVLVVRQQRKRDK